MPFLPPNQQHQSTEGIRKTDKVKSKKQDMLRSISKQSRESVESVLKKRRKAAVGMICRKRRF